mmetsp:Transcript_5307/g.19975  ORF Transcript_5307/g.19975 Transcript_5307/m.19975 type:complete len:156 (-) Transcript_5307:2-469(-)
MQAAMGAKGQSCMANGQWSLERASARPKVEMWSEPGTSGALEIVSHTGALFGFGQDSEPEGQALRVASHMSLSKMALSMSMLRPWWISHGQSGVLAEPWIQSPDSRQCPTMPGPKACVHDVQIKSIGLRQAQEKRDPTSSRHDEHRFGQAGAKLA